MVIANTLNLQNSLDGSQLVLRDNYDYLVLYNEVKVPHTEMERIITVLDMRGHTCVEKLVDQLARNEYDYYLQRRYVYALMFSGEIEFDMYTPIDNDTILWTNSMDLI